MTQAVHVRDILAAGGLKKWKEKAARDGIGRDSRPTLKTPNINALPQKKANLGPPPNSMQNGQIDKLHNSSIFPSAKGRKPKNRLVGYDADRMNKTETMYAELLETQRRAGNILLWRYESVKFRLADRTWYTPDFYIMRPDGSIEIHETKGWMEEDANVKIKTTAEQFPEFVFVLVKLDKGEWLYNRYRARGNQ